VFGGQPFCRTRWPIPSGPPWGRSSEGQFQRVGAMDYLAKHSRSPTRHSVSIVPSGQKRYRASRFEPGTVSARCCVSVECKFSRCRQKPYIWRCPALVSLKAGASIWGDANCRNPWGKPRVLAAENAREHQSLPLSAKRDEALRFFACFFCQGLELTIFAGLGFQAFFGGSSFVFLENQPII
jgi:hypothetical protein